MAKFKRAMIIINPAAGKAEPILSVLNDVFGPAGIDWQVSITHKAGDGAAAARAAAEEGFDLIGAYGGDGTVAEVASALVGDGPPLLVLPGGTGNALADDLGIPPLLAAAAALATGEASEVRRVDLGRVGEQSFVLRLTMGVEAAMVDATTQESKERFGWLAYAISGIQALAVPPVATYRITVDGETFEAEGVAAMVANSASTGVAGVRLATEINVSDGLLDVVVVQSAALPSLLASAADAAQGLEPRGVSRWSGREIRVESTPVQAVLADGEDAGSTPVDVTVVPGAVGVLVPAPALADDVR